MNKTFRETVEFGVKACLEHGFGFIGVYETRTKSDDWDDFIISPVHVSDDVYKYVGYVKRSGEFVGNVPVLNSRGEKGLP